MQAHGLCAVLPDGRPLFHDLALSLAGGPHVLVGRNGDGKSTLLHLLAGASTAATTSGRIHVAGRVHLLTQASAEPACTAGSIAGVLGLDAPLAALARLSAGDGTDRDLAVLDDRWDLATRVARALADAGFAGLDADAPADALSAGERQQLRLLGAWLSDADVLLLDEPTTFLDTGASAAWYARLSSRAGTVLAVTHDPAWLDAGAPVLALASGALRAFADATTWRGTIEAERGAHAEALARARVARDHTRRDAAAEREHLDRRAARGRRDRARANQSPLLLDRQRDRADRTQARLRDGLATRLAAGNAAVRDAFARVGETQAPSFVAAGATLAAGRRALSFDAAHPLSTRPAAALTAHFAGPVRIGLEGRNGAGKTTLLRAIAGECTLAHGRVDAHVRVHRLDAALLAMPADEPAIAWLRACMGDAEPADVANRLALAGLRGTCARRPLGTLSGGERMRVAVAAAAWSRPQAPLLLLDEPASHLDADSTAALVALLRAWPGALLVVSHDAALLDALALDVRLRLDARGLRTSEAT